VRLTAWAERSFSARFGLRGGLGRPAEVDGGGLGGAFWGRRGVSRAAMPSTFMVGARFAKTLALNDYDVSGAAVCMTIVAASMAYMFVAMQLIPTLADQNRCAQSRSPMDMMRHGCSTSLFHASQQ
jgi:hypothetical protein